ncbi:hypothetical protein SFRURICE_000459, partial [Spodoptera frugiperda]
MELKPIQSIYKSLKVIISVKTILFIRLLGGFYFKVNSNIFIRFIACTYCVICLILSTLLVITIVCRYTLSISLQIKVLSNIAKYWISAIISLTTNAEKYQSLLTSLAEIDPQLGVRSDTDIPISRLILLFSLTSEFIVIIWNAINYSNSFSIGMVLVPCYFYMIVIIHFTRVIIFESVWYRVRNLKKRLEYMLSQVYAGRSDKNIRNEIKNCMFIYKKIFEVLQKNLPMKIMVLVTVLTFIPGLVASIHDIISEYPKP